MADTESVVRAFYDVLARGERESALALLDKQIKWTEAERTPYYTGELIGVEAVVETVLGPVSRDFEDFAVIPVDFLTQGDRTAAFGRYTGRFRMGGELNAPFVHLWTVRNGVIVRFLQYTDSAAWTAAILKAASAVAPKHNPS
jgi:ketosteroid isomerase-like protein